VRSTPGTEKLPINIVGSSTFGRYHKISSEKTYNMYESDDWLISYSGWKKVLQLFPSGVGRGVFHSIRGNFIIVVVNSSVFQIAPNLQPLLIGTLATASGEVFMDENLTNQICIVDGLNAYIYNWGYPPNLTIQTFNVDLIPSYVCYINGVFCFGNGSKVNVGALWYFYKQQVTSPPNVSDPFNITKVGGLPLSTKPDYPLAVKRIPGQGNNILVLGSSVCEIFTQVSTAVYFRRNESINVDYGCLSANTIASCDEYIAWLGVNESNAPVIMVYSQQGAQQISTDGISYLMSSLVHPDQSMASFYRKDGHLFYQLTFFAPEDNLTLIYDFNLKAFYHLSDSNLNYHPAVDVVYFNQATYFISLNNACLYQMSSDFTTYDENISPAADPALIGEIPRIRICKSQRYPDASQFIANSLYMMIEQGYDPGYVGLDQSNASLHYVPRVDLALSADGGVTYGNYVSRYMQTEGQRQNQMTWEKMGLYNDWTPKFRFIGMSHFCVNNCYLEAYQ